MGKINPWKIYSIENSNILNNFITNLIILNDKDYKFSEMYVRLYVHTFLTTAAPNGTFFVMSFIVRTRFILKIILKKTIFTRKNIGGIKFAESAAIHYTNV